jgi:hypothetical protein
LKWGGEVSLATMAQVLGMTADEAAAIETLGGNVGAGHFLYCALEYTGELAWKDGRIPE